MQYFHYFDRVFFCGEVFHSGNYCVSVVVVGGVVVAGGRDIALGEQIQRVAMIQTTAATTNDNRMQVVSAMMNRFVVDRNNATNETNFKHSKDKDKSDENREKRCLLIMKTKHTRW